MGNYMGCLSKQNRRSRTHIHGTNRPINQQNSLKNLLNLKKKSELRSIYKARKSCRIIPTNILSDHEEETEEREGMMRVKMVLTKKEVVELLAMLGTSSNHGGSSTERNLFEEIGEDDRIGWTPSLQSIPESEEY